MKILLFICLITLPLIATSGQQQDAPTENLPMISDSLMLVIDQKVDSVINAASRAIDSIAEKPKYITGRIDYVKDTGSVVYRHRWRYKVLHNDTTFFRKYIDTLHTKP